MQLITSVFNKGVFLQNLRNVGWLAIVYFLALFFTVPLHILMIVTRNGNEDHAHYFLENTKSLFMILPQLQLLIMFTVPILLGIFLFRYMQVKLSADFMFSLPMKRRVVLHQQLFFGKLVLLVPIVLNAIILSIMSNVIDLENAILFDHIWLWALSTFLFALLLFFLTAAVGMFTGISVLHGVLTYISIILPAGIILLIYANISYYVKGFSMQYVVGENIDKLYLVYRFLELADRSLTWPEFFGYVILIIVLYVISLIAYEKRPAEVATQAITFKFFRPIFWYGVTFCAMLLGGMYFGETQGSDSFGWIIFGYVTASVIGYYVATMILAKSWRVFHHYKGLIIFIVSMFIVVSSIQLDVFGFEKKIPKLEDVQQVYFGDRSIFYDQNYGGNDQSPYHIQFYQEKENIARIINIHEAIISSDIQPSEEYLADTVVIVYELTNGKKFVREYRNIYLPDYEETYRPLVESKEFKEIENELNHVNIEKITEITFYNYHGVDKTIRFNKEEDIRELIEILQREYNNQTYEEMIDENAWASIEVSVNNYTWFHSLAFKKSFKELTSWLNEKGKLQDIITTSKDVASMKVVKLDGSYHVQDLYQIEGELLMKEGKDAKVITDHKQMDKLLQLASPYGRGNIAVVTKFAHNHVSVMVLTEDELPDFITFK